MASLLVIDDEASFRESLIETLEDFGHSARGVGSVREALAILNQEEFDLIFLDFRLPDKTGLEAIPLIKATQLNHDSPIVMVTAFTDSDNTISAMRLGAFDHLTKPVSRRDVEEILRAFQDAFPERKKTSEASSGTSTSADSLLGNSEAMRKVLKMIGRVAASDSSVLITGATGTGKEVVAKAIHRNSPREKQAFVAVNCAAIPEGLLESELFGHVKGAFTGASNDRKGSFLAADKGTLFLDEIGDMSLGLQAKLLRALQEREITPLGASKSLKVDLRVLAATHQDLKGKVARKEFREDLYFRINVIEINLPSLVERQGDIPLLAEHFLKLDQTREDQKELSASALTKICSYSWPGNIRELKNAMERARVVAKGRVISADDIRLFESEASEENAGEDLDLPSSIARLEKRMIARALRESDGNRSEASRKLGIGRQLLYSKMKEHSIEG